MKPFEKTLAICLETVGSCVILSGVGLEIVTGAEAGYVIITSGACIAAIGAMLFAKIFKRG